jgi:integrase
VGEEGRQTAEEGEPEGNIEMTKKQRGIYEKVAGSKVWWIRYADASGRIRREKVGNKAAAIQLYQKRKTQILQGEKLPEKFRTRKVSFGELAKDALEYCRANNLGYQFDGYRIGRLVAEFGSRNADLAIEQIRAWFNEQAWEAGTYNRYKSTLSMLYRVGIENNKIKTNPARLLKHKREENGRVRFLNQHTGDEYERLRNAIEAEFACHLPEFHLALFTGMRPSEQYALTWDRVDLIRQSLFLPKTKNGNARHIPLGDEALESFTSLFSRSSGKGRVFVNIHGDPLRGYKHWFGPAVKAAGIKHFTWYSLRHTFASWLVMTGTDLRTVADLLGHKSIQMTMRYAHLAPSHKLAAVKRLSAAAGQLLAPTDTSTSTSRIGQISDVAAGVH